MQLRKIFFLIVGILLALGGCATPTPMPTPTPMDTSTPIPTSSPTPTPVPARFRVVAYATEDIVVDLIPFDQLTQINYAFLLPKDDGTFQPFMNAGGLKSLIQRAHQHNVQVLVSVGGWGLDQEFEKLAASSQTRAVFVSELLKIMTEYGFDGADIDWEYPQAGQSAQNFLALMTELRAALPTGKLLTMAVVVSGDNAENIPTGTFAVVDFINVMAYDEPGHGTLEQFNQGLDYWLGRGVPKEKLVMGVPFYSRPGEVMYRDLVQFDPAAAQTDTFQYHGSTERYNGIPTIQKKTQIAQEKASGIMFWNLAQDATGDLSLVNAIHQTILNYKP